MAFALESLPEETASDLEHDLENDLERSGEREIAQRISILRTKQRPPAWAAQIDCMGVPVARGTFEEVRDWFFGAAQTRGREPKVLYFAGAHTCNLAWSDPDYREMLARADVVLNDGADLDLYAWLARVRFADDLGPAALFSRLFASATADRPLRVFLLGGAKGQAEAAALAIEARHPHVRVVGAALGDAPGESVIESINEACADILLVGMDAREQERWIDDNKGLLDVGLVAGVGTLVASLAGTRPRRRSWLRSMLGVAAFAFRAVAYLGLGIAPRALPF